MKELLLRAKNGDKDAKGRLIEENTGLVWSIARRYIGRGVDTEDLFQLGCLGFLKAVEGYDPDFGTQFSTYAVPKIAGEIRRFLRDDGTVKVSRCIKERASAIKMTRQRIAMQYDEEPTLSQIAEALEITVEEVAEAENVPQGLFVHEVEVDSPAMEAGIQRGDILTEIAGEEIKSLIAYHNTVMAQEAGQSVRLKGQRSGVESYVEMKFTVTVGVK